MPSLHEQWLSREVSLNPQSRNRQQSASQFIQHASSNIDFVRRLSLTASLAGHDEAVHALSWSNDGRLLVTGSEDCKAKVWDAARSKNLTSFDTGHTSTIFCAKFLPGTGNEQIITASADKQVRVINLNRAAAKPYHSHRGRVRSVAPITSFEFLSAGEDGTVRQFDSRDTPPSGRSQDQHASYHRRSVLVDQKSEPGGKVAIYCLAMDPERPHLLATGGSDAIVRVFDRRYIPAVPARSRAQWAYCLVPDHLIRATRTTMFAGLPVTISRLHHITGVSFSHTGQQLVASYAGEHIYSFDTTDHAQSFDNIASAVQDRYPRTSFTSSQHRTSVRASSPPMSADMQRLYDGAASRLAVLRSRARPREGASNSGAAPDTRPNRPRNGDDRGASSQPAHSSNGAGPSSFPDTSPAPSPAPPPPPPTTRPSSGALPPPPPGRRTMRHVAIMTIAPDTIFSQSMPLPTPADLQRRNSEAQRAEGSTAAGPAQTAGASDPAVRPPIPSNSPLSGRSVVATLHLRAPSVPSPSPPPPSNTAALPDPVTAPGLSAVPSADVQPRGQPGTHPQSGLEGEGEITRRNVAPSSTAVAPPESEDARTRMAATPNTSAPAQRESSRRYLVSSSIADAVGEEASLLRRMASSALAARASVRENRRRRSVPSIAVLEAAAAALEDSLAPFTFPPPSRPPGSNRNTTTASSLPRGQGSPGDTRAGVPSGHTRQDGTPSGTGPTGATPSRSDARGAVAGGTDIGTAGNMGSVLGGVGATGAGPGGGPDNGNGAGQAPRNGADSSRAGHMGASTSGAGASGAGTAGAGLTSPPPQNSSQLGREDSGADTEAQARKRRRLSLFPPRFMSSEPRPSSSCPNTPPQQTTRSVSSTPGVPRTTAGLLPSGQNVMSMLQSWAAMSRRYLRLNRSAPVTPTSTSPTSSPVQDQHHHQGATLQQPQAVSAGNPTQETGSREAIVTVQTGQEHAEASSVPAVTPASAVFAGPAATTADTQPAATGHTRVPDGASNAQEATRTTASLAQSGLRNGNDNGAAQQNHKKRRSLPEADDLDQKDNNSSGDGSEPDVPDRIPRRRPPLFSRAVDDDADPSCAPQPPTGSLPPTGMEVDSLEDCSVVPSGARGDAAYAGADAAPSHVEVPAVPDASLSLRGHLNTHEQSSSGGRVNANDDTDSTHAITTACRDGEGQEQVSGLKPQTALMSDERAGPGLTTLHASAPPPPPLPDPSSIARCHAYSAFSPTSSSVGRAALPSLPVSPTSQHATYSSHIRSANTEEDPTSFPNTAEHPAITNGVPQTLGQDPEEAGLRGKELPPQSGAQMQLQQPDLSSEDLGSREAVPPGKRPRHEAHPRATSSLSLTSAPPPLAPTSTAAHNRSGGQAWDRMVPTSAGHPLHLPALSAQPTGRHPTSQFPQEDNGPCAQATNAAHPGHPLTAVDTPGTAPTPGLTSPTPSPGRCSAFSLVHSPRQVKRLMSEDGPQPAPHLLHTEGAHGVEQCGDGMDASRPGGSGTTEGNAPLQRRASDALSDMPPPAMRVAPPLPPTGAPGALAGSIPPIATAITSQLPAPAHATVIASPSSPTALCADASSQPREPRPTPPPLDTTLHSEILGSWPQNFADRLLFSPTPAEPRLGQLGAGRADRPARPNHSSNRESARRLEMFQSDHPGPDRRNNSTERSTPRVEMRQSTQPGQEQPKSSSERESTRQAAVSQSAHPDGQAQLDHDELFSFLQAGRGEAQAGARPLSGRQDDPSLAPAESTQQAPDPAAGDTRERSVQQRERTPVRPRRRPSRTHVIIRVSTSFHPGDDDSDDEEGGIGSGPGLPDLPSPLMSNPFSRRFMDSEFQATLPFAFGADGDGEAGGIFMRGLPFPRGGAVRRAVHIRMGTNGGTAAAGGSVSSRGRGEADRSRHGRQDTASQTGEEDMNMRRQRQTVSTERRETPGQDNATQDLDARHGGPNAHTPGVLPLEEVLAIRQRALDITDVLRRRVAESVGMRDRPALARRTAESAMAEEGTLQAARVPDEETSTRGGVSGAPQHMTQPSGVPHAQQLGGAEREAAQKHRPQTVDVLNAQRTGRDAGATIPGLGTPDEERSMRAESAMAEEDTAPASRVPDAGMRMRGQSNMTQENTRQVSGVADEERNRQGESAVGEKGAVMTEAHNSRQEATALAGQMRETPASSPQGTEQLAGLGRPGSRERLGTVLADGTLNADEQHLRAGGMREGDRQGNDSEGGGWRLGQGWRAASERWRSVSPWRAAGTGSRWVAGEGLGRGEARNNPLSGVADSASLRRDALSAGLGIHSAISQRLRLQRLAGRGVSRSGQQGAAFPEAAGPSGMPETQAEGTSLGAAIADVLSNGPTSGGNGSAEERRALPSSSGAATARIDGDANEAAEEPELPGLVGLHGDRQESENVPARGADEASGHAGHLHAPDSPRYPPFMRGFLTRQSGGEGSGPPDWEGGDAGTVGNPVGAPLRGEGSERAAAQGQADRPTWRRDIWSYRSRDRPSRERERESMWQYRSRDEPHGLQGPSAADDGAEPDREDEDVGPAPNPLRQRTGPVLVEDDASEEEEEEEGQRHESGHYLQRFTGHRNQRFTKEGYKMEVSYLGPSSDFVMSGSDSGRIFIWQSKTGQLINTLQTDDVVASCVQPHPQDMCFASSGCQPVVKLWHPVAEEPAPFPCEQEGSPQTEEEANLPGLNTLLSVMQVLGQGMGEASLEVPLGPAPTPPNAGEERNTDNRWTPPAREMGGECSIM